MSHRSRRKHNNWLFDEQLTTACSRSRSSISCVGLRFAHALRNQLSINYQLVPKVARQMHMHIYIFVLGFQFSRLIKKVAWIMTDVPWRFKIMFQRMDFSVGVGHGWTIAIVLIEYKHTRMHNSNTPIRMVAIRILWIQNNFFRFFIFDYEYSMPYYCPSAYKW